MTHLQIAFNIFYLGLGLISLAHITWWVLPMWLLFAIGNGTIGHRYFAHSSFNVSPGTHKIMCVWCTISGYSPVVYWQVQHRHHHRHTDTTRDIHSPVNGHMMSLIGWIFSKKRLESVYQDRASKVAHALSSKDCTVRMVSQYFIPINLIFLAALWALSLEIMLAAGTAWLMEHIRLGLVNLVCHWPGFPGNYRNFDTDDRSHNNVIIGLLGLGFGWHNNHHADAGSLDLRRRWWEWDFEAQIAKLLKKL